MPMSKVFTINMRLAIAVTMVSVWGVASTAQLVPSGPLLLACAPLVLFTKSHFVRPVAIDNGGKNVLVILLVLAAVFFAPFLVLHFVPRDQLAQLLCNPYFVIPLWLLITWNLVHDATIATNNAWSAAE